MGALVAMSMTSEVLVNNLVGSMVESQPGTVEVAFPNSGAAAMPGREQQEVSQGMARAEGSRGRPG